MNVYVVMFVVAVAAVVYFVWSQRSKRPPQADAPARLPTAALAAAPAPSANGSLASPDEYRRVHPSNMLQGKLTCHRCGSNLLRAEGGVVSCSSCGAALYRA